MNVLEKYAVNCGVKIRKPHVGLSYFPVPENPYIIIDNRHRDGANTYDMFSDVIGYIKPILERENIDIFAFQKDGNNSLQGTKAFVGLFKKQEAFLIKHAEMVIASDNLSNYFASALDIPNVGLYSTYPSQATKPIWSNKHYVIESSRDGNLPGYGAAENPKTINLIQPELVAKHILCCLGYDDQINHETVFIGDLYPIKVVEVIPDFAPPQGFMEQRALNLRMDYHFDEQNLIQWLQNRKLNILTEKPISISLLKYFKNNIAQLTVNINDSFDEEYFRKIQSIGINLQIFCEDQDKINDYRFKFFDFEVSESLFKTKEDTECVEKIDANTKFVTGKVLLSQGKKYSCYEAKKAEKELTSQPEVIYDTEEFWKELDHYRLINETDI